MKVQLFPIDEREGVEQKNRKEEAGRRRALEKGEKQGEESRVP